MIVVGVDVHKHSLTAVAVDELGRTLAEHSGAVDAQVVGWARSLDEERLWALEDCRHVTRTLERALIAQGEQLVRVPTTFGAEPQKAWRLEVNPAAPDAQRRLLDGWLRGEVPARA